MTDFDHIATSYDYDFTQSSIGLLQRNSVYHYLEKLPNNLTVLELNCGTGKDALWFSKKGNTVLATDISNEMLIIAKKKSKGQHNLKYQQLDINKVSCLKPKKFNLIFSDFGGLNCLNKEELRSFFKSISSLLTSRGKLILVIMPKNTLWENSYFILKGSFKKAFRRNTNKVLNVNVDGKNVKTWYFNPKDISELSNSYFEVVKTKPIGFFLPPSYLEPFFKRHKRLLNILNRLEKMIASIGLFSRFSDHYLIELQLNE